MKLLGILQSLKALFRFEWNQWPICPMVIVLTLILFSTCSEDEESPTVVNFSENSGQVSANDGEEIEVQILLFPAPRESGMITVSLALGALEAWNFRTDPPHSGKFIRLPFSANQTQTSFKIYPDVTCAERQMKFVISGVTDGLKRGTQLSYQLTIKPGKSFANFSDNRGTVSKRDVSGKVIQINFSGPAAEDGILFLYSSDGVIVPGTRYITIPAMEMDLDNWGYYLPVSFQKGETGAQFTVIPLDFTGETDNYVVQFRLGGSSIKCVPKEDGTNYTLTIVN